MNLRGTMLEKHGIEITEEEEYVLLENLNLIIEANKTINLTRIDSLDDGIVKHLEDSLIGLPYLKEAPEGRYADLGTGGGFPGIPLALLTKRETLLVDSVQKKVAVLDTVTEELKINDYVKGYAGRIEDLSKEQGKSFSVLTARALSSLPSLLELASPLLKMNGWLICYKAKPSEEEISTAISLEKKLGMSLIRNDMSELSDGSTRCILVFKKVAKPKVSLPRKLGMAQKHPFTV